MEYVFLIYILCNTELNDVLEYNETKYFISRALCKYGIEEKTQDEGTH